MSITKATINNFSEVEKLNKKYFKEIRDFKKIIEGENDLFFVIKENKKIIGFGGIHIFHWNNTAKIIDIFIHPDYRRKGFGKKMILKIKQEAKNAGVRTIIAEAPSLNSILIVYLKNGFRICGFNDRYYTNNGKEIAIFLSYDMK